MIRAYQCCPVPKLASAFRHRAPYRLTSYTMAGNGHFRCDAAKLEQPGIATASGAGSIEANGNGSGPSGNGDWHTLPHPKGVKLRSEIQGLNDWDTLFRNDADQPVPDQPFREELLKTGYLVQAAYSYLTKFQDFNKGNIEKGDPVELPMGNLPKLLIPKIGGGTAAALAASAYTVPDEETFVLRATAGLYPGEFVKVFEDKDLSTNPIGFVALSENKKDIAVVFRGTCVAQEWLSNFTVFVTSWDEVDKTEPVIAGKKIQKSVWVETGFENMYRRFVSTPGDSLSLQGQVQRAVTSLLTANKDVVSITVCGHSLGGALAAMCAFDLAVSEINKKGGKPEGDLIPVTCYTWEAPRVGNAVFAKKFSNFKPTDTYLGEPRPTRAKKPYVNMFRVVNKNDVVPKAPYERFQALDLLPWRLVMFLVRTAMAALNGKESSGDSGFHQGGTQVELNLKYAWGDKSSGVTKDLTKLPSQAHSLWINMWLVDHSVKIPDVDDTARDTGHKNGVELE